MGLIISAVDSLNCKIHYNVKQPLNMEDLF